MALQTNEVSFVDPTGRLEEPHPDHVALIAILSFYPALAPAPATDEIILTFDWPVSGRLEEAVRRPHILQNASIQTPPGRVVPYTPKSDRVISYGGGFDSTAAALLFPDSLLVHESPIAVLEGRITDAVIDTAPRLPWEPRVVYTDQRYLFDTYGLPVWTGVFSSSLLHSPRTIIAGSVMDSTYLRDGKGYRPMSDSDWYSVFETIGVTIRPTSFLSELGNARLISDAGLFDETAYCARIPFNDCGTCIKCLRRRLLRSVHGEAFGEFDPSDAVLSELGERPLKWGHSYGNALTSLGWLPDWMLSRLSDVIVELGSDFSFQKYYLEAAFEDLRYPPDERERIERILQSHSINAMPEASFDAMRTFRAIGSGPQRH